MNGKMSCPRRVCTLHCTSAMISWLIEVKVRDRLRGFSLLFLYSIFKYILMDRLHPQLTRCYREIRSTILVVESNWTLMETLNKYDEFLNLVIVVVDHTLCFCY